MRCMVSVKPKGVMPVGWVVTASMVAGYNLRKALEELNISVSRFDTSVSVVWEKMLIFP